MAVDRKLGWALAVAIGVIVTLLLFSERVQRELRPDPVAAHVAIEVEGAGVAVLGPVELAAGTDFTLHAVLEARRRSGAPVYFSEAPALEIAGRRIDGDALRPWPGPEEARLLWFSVEGPRPFVDLEGNQGLEAIRFQEIYRSDWARGWSIPGSLKPARVEWTEEQRALRGAPFGTQRYQVRVELFGSSSRLVPVASVTSVGADEVITAAERFPRATVVLDGVLGPPSRVFGLTQVRFGDQPPPPALAALEGWFELDLAFSRILLLRSMLARAGVRFEALEWEAIDLTAGPPWGDAGAARGDFVRAGERIVVLFDDRGSEGVLDYDDLCFDFETGAEVRRLGEVFSGEGLVEHAPLGRGGTTR